MDRNDYYADINANPVAANQSIHQPEATSNAAQPADKQQTVQQQLQQQQPSYHHYNPSVQSSQGVSNYHQNSTNLHQNALYDLSHTGNEYYSQHLSHLAAATVSQNPTAVVENRTKQSISSSGSLFIEYSATREESRSKKHSSSVSVVAAPSTLSPPTIENASYITLNPVVSKPNDTSQSNVYSSSNYFANLETSLHFPAAKPVVSHAMHNLHHPTHQSNQYAGQQYATTKPVGQVYAEPTGPPVHQEAYDMRQSSINHDYLLMKGLSRLSPPIPVSKGATSTQYQQTTSPTVSFQPQSPQQQNYPAFPTNLSSSSKTHQTSISLTSNQTNYTKAPNQSIPQMHHSYHQHQHRPVQQQMSNVQQRLQQQPQQQSQQAQQAQPIMQQQQAQQHAQYQHYGHPTMYHLPHGSAAADAYASCRQAQHISLERRNEPISHHNNSAYEFHHVHQSQQLQQPQPQSMPISKPALQHNKSSRSHHSQPPSLHLDQLSQEANAANRHYNYNALASAYYNSSATSGATSLEHHQQQQQQQHQQHQQAQHQLHSTAHSVYKAPSKDDSPTAPTMPPEQVRYHPSNLYPAPHNVAQHSHPRMIRRPPVAGSSYSTTKYQQQSLPQASTIHNQDLTYLPTEAEIQHATSDHHHLPLVEIYNHRPLYLNNFYNHPNPQSQPPSLPHPSHYPTKSSKVIYAPYITNPYPTNTDHIQMQQQSSAPESHPRKPNTHDYRFPTKTYHHNTTTSLQEDASASYGQAPSLEHMHYNQSSAGHPYAKQATTYDARIQYGYPKITKQHNSQTVEHNSDSKMGMKSDYVDLEEHIRSSTIHNPKFEQMAALAKHHHASAGMYERYSVEQSYVPSYRMPSSADYSIAKHHHLKPSMLPMGNDCYEATRRQRLPQPSIRDYLSSWNDDEEEEIASEKAQQPQPMELPMSNLIVSMQPVDALKQVVSNLPDQRDATGPLPDILVGIENTKPDGVEEQGSASERLYVLESIPVPLADLSKYRHLNVINRLPDNVVNDLSPEDLANPLVKPVETSLKYIEEVESSRAKSYKSDFEIDVIYEEEVTRSSPKEMVQMTAENLKVISPSESDISSMTCVTESVIEDGILKVESQSPEIVVDVSPMRTIEPILATSSPDVRTQKKCRKSPKSSRRRSSASSSLDPTEHTQRSESVSYQCVNTDADPDSTADPTSRPISKLKIKIFRQPSSEDQSPKVNEDSLQIPRDFSTFQPTLKEVPTLQKLCVETVNTDAFREYLNQVNIAAQLHQNELRISESTTLEISLDRFITEEQASEALQQSIDRFIADDNKPPRNFFDFYSESLETRPLSDVTTLMTQNCGPFQSSSGEDYDEPEVETAVPLALIQDDVIQSLVEEHFSGNEIEEDVVQKEELLIPISSNWSKNVEKSQPENETLFPVMTTADNQTFVNSTQFAKSSPSNCSETSELSDIGLASIDDIMLKEESDSLSESPELAVSPKNGTTLVTQITPILPEEKPLSRFPSVDYNCNENHGAEALKTPIVKEPEPFPYEISKILCGPEEESIRLQNLFPEMVRTRDPEEEAVSNSARNMCASSDDESDSSSSDDDSSSSTDGDSIDQTPMPLTRNPEYVADVETDSKSLHHEHSESPTTNLEDHEISVNKPIVESTAEDAEFPPFCANPISPDRFTKNRQSNESMTSTTPAPSELQSFSEHNFSSDSCNSIVSNSVPNTLRSLSSCSSDAADDDDFSTDNENVEEETKKMGDQIIEKVEQNMSSKQKCTYLSDSDTDSDCSTKDEEEESKEELVHVGDRNISYIDIKEGETIHTEDKVFINDHSERDDLIANELTGKNILSDEIADNMQSREEPKKSSETSSVIATDNVNTNLEQQESQVELLEKTCAESATHNVLNNDNSEISSIDNENGANCDYTQSTSSDDALDLESKTLDSKESETELKSVVDNGPLSFDEHATTAKHSSETDPASIIEILPEKYAEMSDNDILSNKQHISTSNSSCVLVRSNIELQNISIQAYKYHVPSESQDLCTEETVTNSIQNEVKDEDVPKSSTLVESQTFHVEAAEIQNVPEPSVPAVFHEKPFNTSEDTNTYNHSNSDDHLIHQDKSTELSDRTESQESPNNEVVPYLAEPTTDSNSSSDLKTPSKNDIYYTQDLFHNEQSHEIPEVGNKHLATTCVLETEAASKYAHDASVISNEPTQMVPPEPKSTSQTEHHIANHEKTIKQQNDGINSYEKVESEIKDHNEDSMDHFDTMSVNSEDMLENAFNEASSFHKISPVVVEVSRNDFETESINSEDMLESAFNEATSFHFKGKVSDEVNKDMRHSEIVTSGSLPLCTVNAEEIGIEDETKRIEIENEITSEIVVQEENNETESVDHICKVSENVSIIENETDTVDTERMLESAFHEAVTINLKSDTDEVANRDVIDTDSLKCQTTNNIEVQNIEYKCQIDESVNIVDFDNKELRTKTQNQVIDVPCQQKTIHHNETVLHEYESDRSSTNDRESDSESTTSSSTSSSSSSSSSLSSQRLYFPASSIGSTRDFPLTCPPPKRSPLRPSPTLFDLDSEITPIESHLSSFHAFDSFELDAQCEPYRNIDNPLAENRQHGKIDIEQDSSGFDVTICLHKIQEDVENIMNRVRYANRSRRKLSPRRPLANGEPAEKRGRFLIKPIIDINELTVGPITAERVCDRSVDTIDSEVANLLGELEEEAESHESAEIIANISKTTDSLIDDLTLDDSVILENTPNTNSQKTIVEPTLFPEKTAIHLVPRLTDLCANVVQHFCVIIESNEESCEEALSHDEQSESDIHQEMMLEMEAMFMPEDGDQACQPECPDSPAYDHEPVEIKSSEMDINQEILKEIQSILEPEIVHPVHVDVPEEVVVFEDHDSYIQYEEVVPQNLPKFQLKALRQRLYAKYRSPTDRSCSKQLRRKYRKCRQKWLKAKNQKKPAAPVPVQPKCVPVVFKPLPGPRISRTKSCDAPRSYSTSSASSSTSSIAVAARTTRSTAKRPALNHCKSLMEPLMGKKYRPNFDEMLLGINQLYSKPSVNNNNNNHTTTTTNAPDGRTHINSSNNISPLPTSFSTDKVKRLIIPRSKIFDANMVTPKRRPPKPQQSPVVRLIRSPLIDRLCKLSSISSSKMGDIKPTPFKLENKPNEEVLPTPKRRLRTKSMFASR